MTQISSPALISDSCNWGVFDADSLDEFRKFFVEHGFALLRGLWTHEELDQFEDDCTRIQNQVAHGELSERYGNRIEKNLGGRHGDSVPTHIYHVTELSTSLNQAVRHPAIVESMKTWLNGGWMMEGDDVIYGVVLQDARPGPESGYARFGWHSDWQSGPHDPRWPGAVAAIHIDGTSPSNGFLRVVPGSHKWATPAPYENANGIEVPEGAMPTGGHTSTPPPFKMPLTFDRVPGEVGIYCDRGDVLFHDSYTWHAAARGTDDSSRRRHVRTVWRSGENDHGKSMGNIIFPIAR